MSNNTRHLKRKLFLLGLDSVTIEMLLDEVGAIVNDEANKAYDNGYKDGAYSTEAMNYWLDQN